MGRRLTVNIVLAHPETGVPAVFEIGEKVPAWAAGLITNEDVFESDKAASAASDGTDEAIPPKSGKGSGVEAWRAYATAQGFAVEGPATREEIISALDAEKIPTE